MSKEIVKEEETQEIVVNGPVSVEFAEQLATVFPMRLPGNTDSERQIFRQAGRDEVVALVMQAAMTQAQHRQEMLLTPKEDRPDEAEKQS